MMLNCADFYGHLETRGIKFSAGVPDSLLKNICAYISDHGNDTITANEGAAIGLAAGYYLATGTIPLVYMQNSGFGNTINPLTSLVDKEVYSIPVLLMIGWRGEPGVKDEPQHVKQGRINERLLHTLEIPFCILSPRLELATKQLDIAFEYMTTHQAPYAILVRKDTFEAYKLKAKTADLSQMTREKAISQILAQLHDDDIVVSTTGKASREVFEYRAVNNQRHDRDFLTVGCMGLSSQIALGIALQKPNKKIYCLDGDGAFLMHMGSAAIIGNKKPKNLIHIVVNNASHDSVGGQPTVGDSVDFGQIASGCGYLHAFTADNEKEVQMVMKHMEDLEGPVFFEIKVAKGARGNLGRPTIKPVDNKKDFMDNLINK